MSLLIQPLHSPHAARLTRNFFPCQLKMFTSWFHMSSNAGDPHASAAHFLQDDAIDILLARSAGILFRPEMKYLYLKRAAFSELKLPTQLSSLVDDTSSSSNNNNVDAPLCFCAENEMKYFRPFSYPDVVEVGIGVSQIGNSSAVFRSGIFASDSSEVCAVGKYVHVFVDRLTERPVKLPPRLKTVLEAIRIDDL